VTGHTELAIEGTVLDSIFGGCNVHGVVEGNTLVCVTGSGRLGSASPAILANAYGGGLGQYTKVKGNVLDSINGNAVNIYGDVYGGSAMGLVNCNNDGNAQNGYAKTNVILADGTVHGSIYGGGHGIDDALAHVWGPVTVKIDGGEVINVFGCNNAAGAPQDSVMVLVTGGVMDSIFGGGNVAAYVLPSDLSTKKLPFVHISGGDVKYKVVGGGNAADVTGNPYVLISNNGAVIPTIGTSIAENNLGKGIYGGCNTLGTITGNVLVELEGGIIGIEGNGTNVRNKKANIHGGGYGKDTDVHGNVTVNFGKIDSDNPLIHTETPKLYGDLYGGSAFGDVNENANNTTTVNLLNGSIESYHGRKQLVDQDSIIYGKAFGGGLGQKATRDRAGIEAKVYGKVQVNVGYADNPDNLDTYVGQANLVECEVFGCNNQNGSPQNKVRVDVYQTRHIQTDSASFTQAGRTYAIDQVFGGGNESHYTVGIRDSVFVHKCENTIRRLFGAGNAADVYGVDLKLDGGRFNWVFGGGNGERGPQYAANIGEGDIYLHTGGGIIDYLVGGSNLNGTVAHIYEETYNGCTESEITNYFLGSNSDTIFGNVTASIDCETSQKRYVNLYCGSNLAPIYGNIDVTIKGGIFENVFGGSRGRKNEPELGPDYAANIYDFTEAYRNAYNAAHSAYPDSLLYPGDGGHVNLLIKSGTIGNVFGGCDKNGNIEGSITITVDSTQSDCGFFIGNIYGGGNMTNYTPTYSNIQNDTVLTPFIHIKQGTIGGISPNLPLDFHGPENERPSYAGNVFGGGNQGNVTSSPKIIVGTVGNATKVTVKGNVYGGGNLGDVTGRPKVIIVPLTHVLTLQQPIGGNIAVTDSQGNPVSNLGAIGDATTLKLVATADVGRSFKRWTVVEGDGVIKHYNTTTTPFTMGSNNTTITAEFE
ncbi:MAG: hypothetical protein IKH19_07880, partial [Muribaculaceae bacterium]|nr:hypothetical protein [Muribaculaceae bacterium]